MKITGGEHELLGGVSQQPIDRRESGTVQDCTNVVFSPLQGIARRPPMQTGTKLDVQDDNLTRTYKEFTFDTVEYLMKVRQGDDPLVVMWDAYNTPVIPVLDVDNALDYIKEGTLRVESGDEGIYIVNTDVQVQMDETETSPSVKGAYIFLTGSQYQRTYRISITDPKTNTTHTTQFTTPRQDQTNIASQMQTSYIMQQLRAQFTKNIEAAFSITLVSDVMRLVHRDPAFESTLIRITVEDGDNGNFLKVMQHTIDDVDKLPRIAFASDVVRVQPSSGGTDTEYYLRYVLPDGTTPVVDPNEVVLEDSRTLLVGYSGLPEAAYGYSSGVYGTLSDTALPDNPSIDITAIKVRVIDTVNAYMQMDLSDDPEINMYTITINGTPVALNRRLNDSGVYQYHFNIIERSLADWIIAQLDTEIELSIEVGSTTFAENGRWEECVAPDIPFKLDHSTMPILIRKNDTDEWEAVRPEWKDRRSGNELNNKDPSFVGKSVLDVGLFQGRLAFLTEGSVVFSRTAKELDFWRSTVTDITSSDRIDLSTRISGATTFRQLAMHDRNLVVMADAEQYLVNGRVALTPTSAALQLASRYSSDTSVDPSTLGTSLAYAVFDGTYSQVSEYYTRSDTELTSSQNLTDTVKQYIKGKINQLVSDDTNGVLYVTSLEEPSKVYTYTWRNNRGERIMGAWGLWELPVDVEYMWVRSGRLHFVVHDAEDTYVMYIDLNRSTDADLGYRLHLDVLTACSMTDGEAYIGAPVVGDLVVISGSYTENAGAVLEYEWVDQEAGIITVPALQDGAEFFVGYPYESAVIFNPIIPKDQERVSMRNVKLRLNRMKLRVERSGDFTASVRTTFKDDLKYEYDGAVGKHTHNRLLSLDDDISTDGNAFNETLVDTTEVYVPIREMAEGTFVKVSTNSHLPLVVTGYDWSGQLTGSGQRRYF